MKRYLIPILFVFFVFAIPQKAEAQFLNRLQRRIENKVEREVERRAENRADKIINDNLDKVEDAIDGKNKKKNSTTSENSKSDGVYESNENNSNETSENKPTSHQPKVVWSKFDFVPGETVIFEDGPAISEENGEFPSRWDLEDGNAEIAEVDGVNVIVFPHGGAIVPYLKNPKEDYLPDVFTIEFDAYFDANNHHRFWIYLYDKKNQSRSGSSPVITFYPASAHFEDSTGEYPNKLPASGWRHFSVAFTKGKLKVYLNDTRLVNIPHVSLNPTGITFENDGYSADKTFQYMKNFRIAKGGVKYYDRVVSDGKIIVNGIKFDINKASLKPESMGPINKIYQLMVKKPELNFSVEGHTDSDGNDANNLKLSKARGKAVMNKLISLGIDSSRLKYGGFGESKPIDNNSTPEGKANNRRVEFVKF